MANQEHVDILRQGVEEWNRWREQNPDIRPDLSLTDLSGTDLSFADLSNVDLEEANLTGAIFTGVNLSGANLSEASLGYTILSDANLNNANLNNADLSEASLSHADFNNANLSNTDLSRTYLSEADLVNANLSYANLSEADLNNADLSYANLANTNLNNANLSYAYLSSTILGNIDLRTVKGLENVYYLSPLTIGTDTLERSQGDIPEVFLRGAGLSDRLIKYARALVQKPTEYYTCFISYSSKDEKFAQQLYNDLQSEGVRCWFAPEDMDVGDKIKHRIDTSIRQYDKLLLILSKHSIASTWVAYEVERALNKEPAGVPNVLYPVRVDKAILTCEMEWVQDIKRTRHIGGL